MIGEKKMPRPKKNASIQETAAVKTSAPAAKTETSIFLQLNSQEWNISDCREKVLAAIEAAGHKKSEIKTLSIYLKPEDGKIYYAADGDITGSIDL